MVAPASTTDRDPGLELGKICVAMQRADLQLRFARQKRLDMARQALGFHYSENAAEKPVPINILAMAEQILARKLIPKNPRLMLDTFERKHRPATHILQEWANGHIESINLANSLRRVVKDALYYIGIAKVSIATPGDVDAATWDIKAGEPLIQRVDLDDFLYDVHARDFSECGWMAHRIRVRVDLVHSAKYFGPNRKKVVAQPDRMFNIVGDERLPMVGRGYYTNREEYADFVDLWEVWLRHENVVVTISDEELWGYGYDEGDKRRKALRVQDWIGPSGGPYHILGFNLPPDNPMAKGPLHDIYDLHLAVNNIARKLTRQARNTKRITVATDPAGSGGGASEDGKRLSEANDGDCESVKDAQSVTQVVMNEPSQALALLMDAFIQRASWLIGNLDLMGGLGPQAKTATQDKLNTEASSANIGSLQEDTLTFVSCVMKSWIWFEHNHPTKVHQVRYSQPGLPRVQMVRRAFPDNADVHQNDPNVVKREHDFDAMQIRIDPYSLQHQTPQTKAQQLIDFLRNVFLPMAQIAMQQGKTLDLDFLFRKLGEYWDDPDLDDLVGVIPTPKPEEGQQGQSGVGAQEAPMGSKEPTEMIRRSLGADSQQAKEALMGNMMAKGAAMNGQAPTVGAA